MINFVIKIVNGEKTLVAVGREEHKIYRGDNSEEKKAFKSRNNKSGRITCSN